LSRWGSTVRNRMTFAIWNEWRSCLRLDPRHFLPRMLCPRGPLHRLTNPLISFTIPNLYIIQAFQETLVNNASFKLINEVFRGGDIGKI
jgi:hypothetical protein